MNMTKRAFALAVSMAAAMSAVDIGIPQSSVIAADTQAVFYVAPDGSDNGDGSIGSPFATLERARDEVRKINGSMTDYFALRKAANRLKESASTRRGKQ